MIAKKIKYKQSILVWLVVFFFLIQVPYFAQIPEMSELYKYGTMTIFLFCVIRIFSRWNYFEKKGLKLMGIMTVAILFPYIVRLLSGHGFEISMANGLFLRFVFCYILIFENKYKWEKLSALNILLCVYTIINCLTQVFFPGGLYTTAVYPYNWFLGYKNEMIFFMLLALCINSIVSIHNQNSYSRETVFLFTICMFSVITCESSTSLVVLLGWMIQVLLVGRGRVPRWYNFKNILFLLIILSIAIVFFGFQENFGEEIEYFFNKDATMTGRVVVWERSMELFSKSPILGYGFMTRLDWEELLYLPFTSTAFFSHPHNFVMYQLLQGGVVYCLILVLYFMFWGRLSKQYKNNVGIMHVVFIYVILMIEGITESLNQFYLLIVWIGLIYTLKDEHLIYLKK